MSASYDFGGNYEPTYHAQIWGGALALSLSSFNLATAQRLVQASSPAPFNATILTAFYSAMRGVIEAASGSGVTSVQITQLSTTYSMFVTEMQRTGWEAYIQSLITANQSQIMDYQPSPSDISTIVAAVDKFAPVTYAEVQQALSGITPAIKTTLTSANGVQTCLSAMTTALQEMEAKTANAGPMRLALYDSQNRGHLESIYCMVNYGAALWALSAAVAFAFFPEAVLVVAGLSMTYGSTFAIGAGVFGVIGAAVC